MVVHYYGFCAEKSLESVLARLNRLRSTKVDAAEIAGLMDTAAFSIFSCAISVSATVCSLHWDRHRTNCRGVFSG